MLSVHRPEEPDWSSSAALALVLDPDWSTLRRVGLDHVLVPPFIEDACHCPKTMGSYQISIGIKPCAHRSPSLCPSLSVQSVFIHLLSRVMRWRFFLLFVALPTPLTEQYNPITNLPQISESTILGYAKYLSEDIGYRTGTQATLFIFSFHIS